MPSLRSLKARINSAKSTFKMTSAMKAVSMSKFNQASAQYAAYEGYRAACAELLESLGGSAGAYGADQRRSDKKCFVLITSNRGLCGSYNNELTRYFEGIIKNEKNYSVIVCGRWGAGRIKHNAEYFEISDIATYTEAEKLFEKLSGLYVDGKCGEIVFVYQDQKNMLICKPVSESFLPIESKDGGAQSDVIYLPSKEEIAGDTLLLCLKSRVFGILLKASLGAQSATLMAMKTASESSEKMLNELNQTLNRIRQAAITTEVIEVSGAAGGENK